MTKDFKKLIEELKAATHLAADLKARIHRQEMEVNKEKMMYNAIENKIKDSAPLIELIEKIDEIDLFIDNFSKIYPDIKDYVIEKLAGKKEAQSTDTPATLITVKEKQSSYIVDDKISESEDVQKITSTYSKVEVVNTINASYSRAVSDIKLLGNYGASTKSKDVQQKIPDVPPEEIPRSLFNAHKYLITQLRSFASKNYHFKYDNENDLININFSDYKLGNIYNNPCIETSGSNRLIVDTEVQRTFRDHYCFNLDAFVKDCLDGIALPIDTYAYEGHRLIWYTPDSGLVMRMKSSTFTMRYFKIIYNSKSPEGWEVKFSQTPHTTKWFKPSDGSKYSDNTECLVPYIRFRRKDYYESKKLVDILKTIPNIRFYDEKDKNYCVGKIGYVLHEKIRYYIFYENGIVDKEKSFQTETLSSYAWILRSDGDILKSFDIEVFVASVLSYFSVDALVSTPQNVVTYQECVAFLDDLSTLEELESVAKELNNIVAQLDDKDKIIFRDYYGKMYARLSELRY